MPNPLEEQYGSTATRRFLEDQGIINRSMGEALARSREKYMVEHLRRLAGNEPRRADPRGFQRVIDRITQAQGGTDD